MDEVDRVAVEVGCFLVIRCPASDTTLRIPIPRSRSSRRATLSAVPWNPFNVESLASVNVVLDWPWLTYIPVYSSSGTMTLILALRSGGGG